MTPNLIIIDQVDPERLAPGGTDTCIHDLVKYSEEGSVGVVGVTATAELSLGVWTETTLAGKRTPFLPVARLDRTRRRGLRVPESLQVAIGLLRFWRRIPTVMTHVHRVETGALIHVLGRREYVQFLHNDASGLTGQSSDSIWKRFPNLYRILEKLSIRSARKVILFSKGDSERVRLLVPTVEVVETWFDPNVFFPRTSDWVYGQPLRVCFIGRLEEQKDPLLGARAFAQLHRMYPQSDLRVIGQGSLKLAMERELQNLGVAGAVHFEGSLPLREVATVMRTSDVLLMSSHYEGSPRVIAEAAACGLPIACTTESDPDVVVVDTVNGFRVESRDPARLGQAILEAAKCERARCAEAVALRSAHLLIPKMLNAGRNVE